MSEAGERTVPTRLADRLEKLGKRAYEAVAEVGLGASLLGQSLFWVFMGPRRAQPVRIAATFARIIDGVHIRPAQACVLERTRRTLRLDLQRVDSSFDVT